MLSPVRSGVKFVVPVTVLNTLLANVNCTVAPLAADAPAVASAPTMKRGNSVCLCLFIFDFMFCFVLLSGPVRGIRGRGGKW